MKAVVQKVHTFCRQSENLEVHTFCRQSENLAENLVTVTKQFWLPKVLNTSFIFGELLTLLN